MVPYDHPVYHNGKRVLWHGVGKGEPDAKSEADAKTAKDKVDQADEGGADAAPDAKPDPKPDLKSETKPKPKEIAVVTKPEPKPDAEFVLSVDIDDPYAAHMAGDIIAAVKSGGIRARLQPGKASAKAIGKLVDADTVDFALLPLDALTRGDPPAWKGKAPYVARLANETIEIVARKEIASVRDLDGKLVSVGLPDSGAEVMATGLLASLGVKSRPINDNVADGLDELTRGKIDAAVMVGVGQSKALARFVKGGRFHLLSLPMTPALAGRYAPVKLGAAERPTLLEGDAKVDTLSAPMALIAVGAAVGSPRAARDASFVKAMFDALSVGLGKDAEPAWRDVNLAATIDWPRSAAAEQWLAARAKPNDPAVASFRALGSSGAVDANQLFESLKQARGSQP